MHSDGPAPPPFPSQKDTAIRTLPLRAELRIAPAERPPSAAAAKRVYFLAKRRCAKRSKISARDNATVSPHYDTLLSATMRRAASFTFKREIMAAVFWRPFVLRVFAVQQRRCRPAYLCFHAHQAVQQRRRACREACGPTTTWSRGPCSAHSKAMRERTLPG